MKKLYIVLLTALLLMGGHFKSSAQICDPSVPLFNIDLTGNPNGTWTSPLVTRNGQCCSASGSSVCVEFIVTLDSAATGISFDIIAGAVPGGALFYQVNCGTPSALGSPICLTGVGPHYITFCKPGNNDNVYQIQSIPQPSAGGTQWVSQACTGFLTTQGLNESSISVTSIPSNPVYNSFLNCPTGCDTIVVTPTGIPPAYVDYQVCGNASGPCGVIAFCDTVRINFVNNLGVTINPQAPTICFGGANAVVTANPTGGLAPFSYSWSNGATTQSISVGAGTYIVSMTDAMNCMVASDTVVVTALPSAIDANAGADQLLCNGAALAVGLNGTVAAATGGTWLNGSGTYSPDNNTLNATYTPSAGEIASGTATLMLLTTGNSGCPPDSDYVTIQIAPQPSPTLTGALNVCQYASQWYSATNATPVNYTWAVSGGNITANNGDSIAVYWNTLGTGNVTLTAANVQGCDTMIQLAVAVNPQPAPVISGSASACAPATMTYYASNAMNDAVSWNVMGGTISGASNRDSVVVIWASAGTGTVMVTETNALGCDSSKVMVVNLYATPVTSISGLQTMCGVQQATYTAALSNAVSHTWSVSGGSIVSNNGISIDVLWSNVGTNNITMTATNADGCDTTISYPVIVYPQSTPAISGPAMVCTPSSSTYAIVSPSGNAYSWVVTGGTISGSSNATSVIVNWNSTGTGTVSVTELNSNGCDSTVTVMVNQSSTPVTSISGLQTMCGVQQATYTAALSNAVSHTWSVSGGSIVSNNGSSIDVLWSNVGTNNITMTATNADGCDTTISYPVIVYPQPTPAISGPAMVCTPSSSTYAIVSPSGNAYSWVVTGGTISGSSNATSVIVNWNSTGTGTVSVTELNSNGCDSTVTVVVNQSSTPVTSISGLQTICGALQATYTASASNAVSYSWSVSGGSIIGNNGSTIDVQWSNVGTNNITLTATNADGCDTAISYPVTIYPQPVPAITGSSSWCTPVTTAYHITSPTSNAYSWMVTGGNITGASTGDSITVVWNAAGTGIVTVTETNSNGCDSTVALVVNLSATPITSVSGPQNICGQETYIYSASPSNAVTYNWTVSGGSIQQYNGDSIMVHWTGSGTGTITLTAANADGCDTTIYYSVNLHPKPAPVVNGPSALCLPASSTYRVSSPGNNNYSWVVTEGTILGSASADSIAVQWNNITGTGTVIVVATNAYGCDSTTSMSVALSTTPSPSITGQQTFCGEQSAVYSATASNAVVYNWTVNGGFVLNDNGDSILVYWNAPGTGNITLTAVNAEGCDTTLNYLASIYPQPAPQVTGAGAVCTPSSSVYALTAASNNMLSWTVNGGTIVGATGADSIQVNWNSTGTGTIDLTEMNSYGCDTTVTVYVTLNPYPAPAITGDDLLCQTDTATYEVPYVAGHTYDWSVTGGAIISFTITNTIDVYWYNPGAGSVRVNQVSTQGCAAVDTEVVAVHAPPTPSVTGPIVTCLNDQTSYLSNQSAGSTYEWTVTGGNISGSTDQPYASIQWLSAGLGIINVKETNMYGCSASVPLNVFVNTLPSASITGSQVGCVDPYGTPYAATALNNVYYQWSVTGGNLSGSNGQSHANITWDNTGIGLIDLQTINTITGCRSTTSLQVLVDSMPMPQITSNSFAGCAPMVTTFGSSPTVANYSYQWAFGDGSGSVDAVGMHTYNNPGSYMVTLIATNNTGCWDTVHSQVLVFNAPVADFSLNVSDEFYPADETSFTLNNTSAGGLTYLWSFGDGNTSTQFEPSYQYHSAGSYDVMLITTNAFGCRDSMLTHVEIKVPEELYVPNAFTPNGDTKNDGFSVATRNITELRVSIFNRWGEEIFQSNEKDFVWDGTYFGNRVEEGVYVYKIAAKGFHGQQFNKVGTVSVLK